MINKKRKVAIIGTAGVPSRYGGFETLAHQLVNNLNSDFKLSVYCSKGIYSKEERVKKWNGAKLVYLPLSANGVQSIFYDILSMFHALFFADVMIVLGVSGGIIIPFIKLFTKKKIIVNIDGLEWRRNKWSKPIKKFLKFSEKIAVRYSDADITDNESIKRYTAIYYKTLSHLIEYGADHCKKVKLTRADREKHEYLSRPYAFKVCRIEPENNVHVILRAFSKLENKSLVIVGNWKKSSYGLQLLAQYAKFENIHMLDPIYDQDKLDKLRSNCHVYVHGHSAGGTNPSLVEAMYLELPVIAFDVSYNRATMENQGLFFKDEVHLKKILESTTLPEYQLIRQRLKEVANRRYTWSTISKKYAHLMYCFDYAYKKKSVFSKTSRLEQTYLIQQGMAHLKSPKMFYEESYNQSS